MAVVHGVEHTGRACRLHAVDLHMGADGLDGAGHAGNQTAAADGHDHRVHVAHFVHDFKANGALTGDDVLVVKGMNEGVAPFLFQFQGPIVGIVVNPGHQTHLSAVALGGLHLGDGGSVRQADQGGNAALAGSQRHALGVVSGGAGDNPPGLFLLGQHGDFVAGAAKLKGAGFLQALGF